MCVAEWKDAIPPTVSPLAMALREGREAVLPAVLHWSLRRGKGEREKTCRSRNVMHSRVTITRCRAKDAAAGRPIPRWGGTPRTHPLLRRHRTDPHVPRPSATRDTGRRVSSPCPPPCVCVVPPPASPGRAAQPRSPRPRRQHLGQRPGLRAAPRRATGDRGRGRWGTVARS